MTEKKITNSKSIPQIPMPFKEVIADVLKVKPPANLGRKNNAKTRASK